MQLQGEAAVGDPWPRVNCSELSEDGFGPWGVLSQNPRSTLLAPGLEEVVLRAGVCSVLCDCGQGDNALLTAWEEPQVAWGTPWAQGLAPGRCPKRSPQVTQRA